MSSEGTKPGKEDPTQPCREGGGSGDPLPSSQSCMPNHIFGMAGEQLTEQNKAPLLKTVQEAATLCTLGVGQ